MKNHLINSYGFPISTSFKLSLLVKYTLKKYSTTSSLKTLFIACIQLISITSTITQSNVDILKPRLLIVKAVIIEAYVSNQLSAYRSGEKTSKEEVIAWAKALTNSQSSGDRIEEPLEEEKVKSSSVIEEINTLKYRQLWIAITFIICSALIVAFWRIAALRKQKRLLIKERDNSKLKEEDERLKAESLKRELELKEKRLVSQAIIIAEKNEVLSEFKQNLLSTMNGVSKKEIDITVKSLEKTLQMKEKNWERFKASFETVHESFFENISQKHPDLTPREMQLCALSRLNLSIKEVSSLLGISADSVKKARYRIRKKFNLANPDYNLATYLMSF